MPTILETITGTELDDVFLGSFPSPSSGTAFTIVYNGMGGVDTMDYSGFAPGGPAGFQSGVTVDLAAGSASASFFYLSASPVTGFNTLMSIENVIGSAYRDTITGDANDNLIRGGAGNDLLSGGDGVDTLDGGDDHDDIFGGNGVDKAYGGNGDDLIRGEAGDDLIYGNDGVDTLDGGDDNDQIWGGNGVDKIYGGNGNDKLSGEAGDDLIFGNDGADVISGGLGRDILEGGAGADTFNYDALADVGNTSAARDLISDFAQGTDKIDLFDIDANAKLAGNQAFTFGSAGSTFNGTSGLLKFYKVDVAGTANDRTFVIGDVNGDKSADFQIEIAGLKQLVASDFIL